MPPFWKIKREVNRIARKVVDGSIGAVSDTVNVSYYDLLQAGKNIRTPGRLPALSKVAVYLVFPSAGVLPSHLAALRHLSDNGYEPLVISNLPLEEADRALLADRAGMVIERPNFGYDFGGYREGVLELAERLPMLERLVLLNDSAWFPLPGAHNWLAEAEALDRDFTGAATSFGLPHATLKNMRQLAWSLNPADAKFHYASFGLMFGPNLLRNAAFLQFWRRLKLTNDKRLTVSRGEIGLTKWVQRKGFSHGATLDVSTLDEELAALPDAALQEIFRGIVMPDSPEIEAAWQKAQAPSRGEATAFILGAAANQGPAYALAGHLWRQHGFAGGQ